MMFVANVAAEVTGSWLTYLGEIAALTDVRGTVDHDHAQDHPGAVAAGTPAAEEEPAKTARIASVDAVVRPALLEADHLLNVKESKFG